MTKEYYAANGNIDAAVELFVVAAMNQMSGLFLRELSLSFELVKPTGSTRYYSAMTTATLPAGAYTLRVLREGRRPVSTRFVK